MVHLSLAECRCHLRQTGMLKYVKIAYLSLRQSMRKHYARADVYGSAERFSYFSSIELLAKVTATIAAHLE